MRIPDCMSGDRTSKEFQEIYKLFTVRIIIVYFVFPLGAYIQVARDNSLIVALGIKYILTIGLIKLSYLEV